ncbi:hypothetical protein SK128_001074 [Halocaridina rubra]|uniref:Uncharacterized protein n=1 Tax=Halocaridina rubra TaxID=373956 RepID=A0AAN8XHQ1_HALRR
MNVKENTKEERQRPLTREEKLYVSLGNNSKQPFQPSLIGQWTDNGWTNWVPRCGGCLAPRMTIRLLGSLVLVSGVLVSSAEGSLLVREEQQYQRCLLHQKGLIGSRHDHFSQPPERGNAKDLSLCYPHDINLVRACTGIGVILLVLLILCTILMFVAIATERWSLSFPWAIGCGAAILQEIVLVGSCWTILGVGDLVLYAIHILLLAYSTAVLMAVLRLVKTGEYEADAREL